MTRRIVGDANRRVESAEHMMAVERFRPAARRDEIAVIDGRSIETARERQVPPILETDRVGREQAPRVDGSIEIDSRIERLSIDLAAGLAVGERASAGDAAIGIEVAELGGLSKRDAAAVECAASSELVTTLAKRDLPGQAAVALIGLAAVDQAVATLSRLVVQQHIGDAAEIWKRRVAGIGTDDGSSDVSRRKQRSLFGNSRLIDRLVERRLVDVAVERVGVDIAEVAVEREGHAIAQHARGVRSQKR